MPACTSRIAAASSAISVAAYEEFGRAATEAKEHAAGDPRYAKTAEAAERERDALAPKLGFVTVTVQNSTPETKLDDCR